MPARFDTIDCRAWTGKPYRSKQRKLVKGTITEVHDVEITESFSLGGLLFSQESANMIANSDGFDDFDQMAAWYKEEYGLPFKGVLITWKPLPP